MGEEPTFTRRTGLRRAGKMAGGAGLIALGASASATADPNAESDADADVFVRDDGTYGSILVDANDRTLYVFSKDSRNGKSSKCDSDPNSGNPNSQALAALSCSTKWPAFTVNGDVEAGDDVKAHLDTFGRDDPDGSQVTAKNHPLYYNVQDTPGTVRGPPQDSGGTWFLLDEKGHRVSL